MDTSDQGPNNPRYFRSSEDLIVQGLRTATGSTLGSAPSRYPMLHTAPSQEHGQPQGLSSPTSPSPISATTSTPPLQQRSSQHQHQHQHHHHRQHPSHGITTDLPQIPPPHLRHHSYPSVLQHHPPPPPPTSLQPLDTSHTSSAITSTNTSPDRQFGTPNPYLSSDTAPSVPGNGIVSSQPPNLSTLGLLPETHSHHSPLTAMSTVGGPSVHPLWAARPAMGPLSSISESALSSYSQVSVGSQAFPVHSHSAAASVGFSQPYTYPMPLHLSTAGAGSRSSVAAVAGAGDGNEMDIAGAWRKQWTSGSSGS